MDPCSSAGGVLRGVSQTSRYPVANMANTAPTRPPVAIRPLAVPRAWNGTHLLTTLPAVGYAPACENPNPSRSSSTARKEETPPINPVNRDHNSTYKANIDREPKRSDNHPAGTWPNAYVQKKALSIQAISELLSPRSSWI